jgi:RNA polymerase sigma-70 factor (ECF subfamily)
MDRAELERLYACCGAAVERRCRALLGDGEEARDMVQEVFLRAVIHGREFRGAASPFTWLYRISTNLCLNRLRDRKQHLPLSLVAPLLESGGVSPERAAAARQASMVLFDGLDEKTQQLVVYRYLDELGQEEIAVLTGWSRKTIGKKLKAFEARAVELMTPTTGSVR